MTSSVCMLRRKPAPAPPVPQLSCPQLGVQRDSSGSRRLWTCAATPLRGAGWRHVLLDGRVATDKAAPTSRSAPAPARPAAAHRRRRSGGASGPTMRRTLPSIAAAQAALPSRNLLRPAGSCVLRDGGVPRETRQQPSRWATAGALPDLPACWLGGSSGCPLHRTSPGCAPSRQQRQLSAAASKRRVLSSCEMQASAATPSRPRLVRRARRTLRGSPSTARHGHNTLPQLR
jgi:hypothetical protein